MLSVALPMGLTLDEVIIQGESLVLEKDPIGISLPQPGSIEVRVSEPTIAAFLESKSPGVLSDFKITLLEGYVRVEAKASILISKLDVAAVCQVKIEDETKLIVELIRVEAIGGTGAHNIVQRQIDNINPLLDAEKMPFALTMTSVEVEKHWLVVNGTITTRPK